MRATQHHPQARTLFNVAAVTRPVCCSASGKPLARPSVNKAHISAALPSSHPLSCCSASSAVMALGVGARSRTWRKGSRARANCRNRSTLVLLGTSRYLALTRPAVKLGSTQSCCRRCLCWGKAWSRLPTTARPAGPPPTTTASTGALVVLNSTGVTRNILYLLYTANGVLVCYNTRYCAAGGVVRRNDWPETF